MTDEKKTMQETVRAPQRVPAFDPMKFAQEVGEAGEKVLALKYKKAWFRAACPNGGVVLNPLRVTDQMAIFEARVFADTEDRNPLASFIATRAADKATGKQYIQAAQEDALNEALENAGFGLPLIPMPAQTVRAETETNAVGGNQPTEMPSEAEVKQTAEPVKKTAENAQPVLGKAPPVEPSKAEAKPTETKFQRVVETTSGKPAVVDISTAKAAEKETQPVADAAPAQDAPVPAGEDTPITYTPDMTVEEITRLMTLEQAKQIKVQDGTCKGWTLEQVAADRPPSLKWLKFTAPFADNVLKAAAGIVLADLELKKAG